MRTRGPCAALIALAIFAGPVACDAATFRVVTDQTTVAFAVSNFGIGSHEGRFDLSWGKIVLDAERRSGSIEFVVEAGSVDTGWDLRDAFLKSDLMFDVKRYPSIRFRSGGNSRISWWWARAPKRAAAEPGPTAASGGAGSLFSSWGSPRGPFSWRLPRGSR